MTTFFPAKNYSLADTLGSGQAFRWRLVDDAWESVVSGRWVRLKQASGGIEAEAAAPEAVADWKWLSDYLQLDVNIQDVVATFPKDPHLDAAIRASPGLRLLRQDPWECLASFILSSTKQIIQIQQIVDAICSRFGESVQTLRPGTPAFAFPSALRIAPLSEEELRCCKTGFRAPYLKGTAEMVSSGKIDLTALRDLDVDLARAALMEFPGVGRKIADCVLLFAYGFQEAFPVDVWVLKALRQLYFPRRRPSLKKILAFTQSYFGPNAGYAQQYLFHYMRTRIGRKNGQKL